MEIDDLNPKDAVGRKKDPIHLVPTESIRVCSHAMKYGAFEAKRVDGKQGYGPYNWRETKVSYNIYLDATIRHSLKLLDGEDLDPDSLIHHLGHIMANAAILIDALKTNSLVDDRPKLKEQKLQGCTFIEHKYAESHACKTEQCRCNSQKQPEYVKAEKQGR